ncbi:MAG: hypothetical protein M1812_004952 [Candelaria pacifica]|nr:MAG: hypothetical protein M1812_004952 [Candelaria pacifica]
MSSADNSSPEPARSRSASRRRRRQKAQKSQNPMPALEESQAENAGKEVQGFDRIGGPETSMNGPISKARVERGEIPPRRGEGQEGLQTKEQGGGESDMMQKDGLKLRVELNLDVEIELKASIRGDLTIALL